MTQIATFTQNTSPTSLRLLSEFKITDNQIYVKSHLESDGIDKVVKTLGTERHKALIGFLISAREEAGITQTELAEKLGEYQSFVARLESGQRRVDVVEFLELAEVIGFDPIESLKKIQATDLN